MRLSIFSRLTLGYLAVFVAVMSVNIYTIFQLHKLNNITRSVTDIDNRIIDYGNKLSDSFLSQVKYERNYIIVSDDSFYDQFLIADKDFVLNLEKATALSDTTQTKDLLAKIGDYHGRYQTLFYEEAEFIKANKSYPEDWYKHEKAKTVDGITQSLKNLKTDTEHNTYKKIKRLEEAGAKARNVAMVMSATALFLCVVISIYITCSITRPLAVIKKKTRDIAKGDFDVKPDTSSPSEIEDLFRAFSTMCCKLKEMDKIKSDFFSLMAHELRTPLTSIKEGTNLLSEGIGGEITDKQKKLLKIIMEESNRMIDLVNSLLDFSKMRAGMMTFNFTDSDINPLIDRAIAEIEPLAAAKNITARKDISRIQVSSRTRMDDERILQVLRNLIGNAVKFTPNGGLVTVSVENTDEGLKVSVTDTGPGMSKEILTTVFNKFEQVKVSNEIKGTGLGLAIVEHIINAHGGRVWIESELGHGSTFIFVLPS